MGENNGMLIAAFAAVILLMTLVSVLMYRMGSKQGAKKARAELIRENAIKLAMPPVSPDPVVTETGEQQQLASRPPLNRYVTKELFRHRYESMFPRLQIPSRAGLIEKEIDIFSLKNVRILHYFWKTESALNTFPQWSSIERYLDSPSHFTDYEEGDENNLYKLTIPLSKIESFTTNARTGEVILHHYNFSGQPTDTVFLGDRAAELLRRMIPGKEGAFIKRQQYLKSTRNIKDMKELIAELNMRMENGEITREMYNAKKLEIVLKT